MATKQDTLSKLASYDGVAEDPVGSNHILFNEWHYGRRQAAPWCATYLSYCLHHSGVPVGPGNRGTAYTPSFADWAKREGLWVAWDRPIEPGWIVLFYFPSKGRIAHCGVTSDVGSGVGSFRAWEGNTDARGGRTGGRVLQQARSRGTVGSSGGFVNLNRYYTGVRNGGNGGQGNRCALGHPLLRSRARGFPVKHCQDLLVRNGAAISIDGDFGAGTERAVRSYQSSKGLKADGQVGPLTWGSLHQVVGQVV